MRPLVLAAILCVTLAAPAEAKVWFARMSGRTVAWDQRVRSEILGCPGNPSCRAVAEGLAVYVQRRHGRAQHRVAGIDADGRIAFRVPHIAPGRYRLRVSERGALRQASDWFRISALSTGRAASGRTRGSLRACPRSESSPRATR